MELMKHTSVYYDWKHIKKSGMFINVPFNKLKVGDIVISYTYTHSQKYMIFEGYEEYNCMKYGILLTKNKINPEKSILYTIVDEEEYDFEEQNLYADPGKSGGFILYKCILY